MARSRYPELTRRIGLASYRGPSGIGAKESQRTMSIIANSLDQMSNYFFKKAGVKAELDAEKFGAENTPSLQDYKNSISGGTNPLDQYDRTTIFGKTAFNIVSKNLANSLLITAKNQMNDEAIKADRDMTDVSEFSKSLNSIVLENIKLASEISPSIATQVSADLNITASGHYYKHGIKVNKLNLDKIQSQGSYVLNSMTENLDKEIFAVFDKNKKMNAKELSDKIYGTDNTVGVQATLKTKYAREMLGLRFGKTAFKSGLDNWDKEWVKSVSSLVQTFAFQTDTKISDITKNLVQNKATGDVRIDALISKIDPEDRIEIAKQIRAIAKGQLELEDKLEIDTLEKNDAEIANLEVQITNDIANRADPDRIKKNLLKLKGLVDPEDSDNPWVNLSIQYNKSGGVRKYEKVLKDLSKKENEGTLTYKELVQNINNLNTADFNTLANKLEQNNKADFATALQIVAGELQFTPDAIILSEQDPNYEKQQIYANIKSKLKSEELLYNQTKRTQDKNFNYIVRAREIAKAEAEIIYTKIFEQSKKTTKYFVDEVLKVYPNVIPNNEINRRNLEDIKKHLKQILTNKDLRKETFAQGPENKERERIRTYLFQIQKLLDNERLEQ